MWKVGASPFFDGLTHNDLARMVRNPFSRLFEDDHWRSNSQRKTVQKLPVAANIPSNFDSRDQWPLCNIDAIRDQEMCGSCWAFSSTEELADRICIASNMKKVVTLSPQFLMSCDSRHDGGCFLGDYTDLTHYDLCDIGVPLESCVPYKGVNSKCMKECVDGSRMTMYKIRDYYDIYTPFDSDKTVRAIQTEIMTHGPVSATFHIFSDFNYYSSGIYSRSKGTTFTGDHVVKIIGWGEENGTPYWTIANSLGDNWGENVFFRFIRGKNDCGIEDEAIAGIPDI